MKKTIITFLALLSICFSSLSAQIIPKESVSIRVMSYNVRNSKDMNDKINYQQTADVINKVLPDVVALQELDSVTTRNQQVVVLDQLAKRTSMFGTYGAAIDFQGGKYGVGVLSKEKPISYRTIHLPGREEQRVFLIVEFEKYVLGCTHFSLTEADRELSVPIIEKAIEGIKKPLILAGDMNSTPQTKVQKMLAKQFIPLNDTQVFTIPSDNPKECIDYIYARKDHYTYSVSHREVMNEPVASDHLPLFIDLTIE